MTTKKIEKTLRAEGFPIMMTTKEVARASGYSTRTVERWRDRGLLRAAGPGHPRYLRHDVARFMAGE